MYILRTYNNTLISCIYCHKYPLFVDFIITLPEIINNILKK